jgi:hypothetical protein
VAVPHAGGDAIFDFLQICRHSVKLNLGVIPSPDPRATSGDRLPAIYRRIQGASPPPARADGRPWEFGIRVHDGTENGQPFRPEDGDDSWKRQGVVFVRDIASLDQPAPATIVLDRWLVVPARPRIWEFPEPTNEPGFRSASYPQPDFGTEGVARVAVDYYGEYELPWSKVLPGGSAWVAFSFDRFQPPERESVEFIGRVQERCDCDGPTPAGEQARQVRSDSA